MRDQLLRAVLNTGVDHLYLNMPGKYTSQNVYFLVGCLQGFVGSLVGYQIDMMTICRINVGFVGSDIGY